MKTDLMKKFDKLKQEIRDKFRNIHQKASSTLQLMESLKTRAHQDTSIMSAYNVVIESLKEIINDL